MRCIQMYSASNKQSFAGPLSENKHTHKSIELQTLQTCAHSQHYTHIFQAIKAFLVEWFSGKLLHMLHTLLSLFVVWFAHCRR